MTMKKFFCAMGVAAALTACTGQINQKKEAKLPTVKTFTIEQASALKTVECVGKVRPADKANLSFRVSGTLKSVPVSKGDAVRKGQLLAAIDDRDYQLQFSATSAKYEQVKGEATRVMELYKTNSCTKNDYEKAVYGLQQIEALYNAHRNALADTKLTAPFDGYVEECRYHEGETLGAGYPAVVLSSSQPEVEINLTTEQYGSLSQVEAYRCQLPDGREIALQYSSASAAVNMNQLYTARLAVPTDYAKLLPAGSVVKVWFDVRQPENNNCLLPLTALFTDGEKTCIWILEDGILHSREVQTGAVHDDGLVVVEGNVRAGEQVVAAGVKKLHEGQAVRPLAPVSQTNKGGLL